MGRGFCPLDASATHRVEAGGISGVVGLTKPIPKPTPGAPQGLARLIGLHLGGVAQIHRKARACALDGPGTISKQDPV